MARTPWDTWARGKVGAKAFCKVAPETRCIPLRGDPICRACYEAESEATHE